MRAAHTFKGVGVRGDRLNRLHRVDPTNEHLLGVRRSERVNETEIKQAKEFIAHNFLLAGRMAGKPYDKKTKEEKQTDPANPIAQQAIHNATERLKYLKEKRKHRYYFASPVIYNDEQLIPKEEKTPAHVRMRNWYAKHTQAQFKALVSEKFPSRGKTSVAKITSSWPFRYNDNANYFVCLSPEYTERSNITYDAKYRTDECELSPHVPYHWCISVASRGIGFFDLMQRNPHYSEDSYDYDEPKRVKFLGIVTRILERFPKTKDYSIYRCEALCWREDQGVDFQYYKQVFAGHTNAGETLFAAHGWTYNKCLSLIERRIKAVVLGQVT